MGIHTKLQITMVRQGFKHSKIARAKMSIALLGRRCSMKTEFARGHVPFNKGTKGFMKKNKTSFKKGNIPHNFRNYYKATKDGIYVKVGTKMCNTKKYGRIKVVAYENLARVRYREAHGEFDKKLIVAHKDGDVFNCEIENLELITRSENLKRNRTRLETCKICGKEYQAISSNSKTCSTECHKKNNKILTKKWQTNNRKKLNLFQAKYREKRRLLKQNQNVSLLTTETFIPQNI